MDHSESKRQTVKSPNVDSYQYIIILILKRLSFYLFISFLFSLVYKSTRTNTEEETESIKEEDVVTFFAF